MAAEFEIALQDAVPPLVLALDVGSTASRGMIYDAHGRPAGRRAKVAHGFTVAPDGTSVIDPDQVLEELSSIVDGSAKPRKDQQALVDTARKIDAVRRRRRRS